MTRTLLAVLALIAATPVLAAPVADGPVPDVQGQLDAKVIDCITSQAPAVERAEPSLTSATTFLVSDLCAREIDLAERYRLSSRMLAQMRRTQAQMVATMEKAPPMRPTPPPAKAAGAAPAAAHPAPSQPAQNPMLTAQIEKQKTLDTAYVDPRTGEIEGADEASNNGILALRDLLGISLPQQISPRFRAAAARALLAAREHQGH